MRNQLLTLVFWLPLCCLAVDKADSLQNRLSFLTGKKKIETLLELSDLYRFDRPHLARKTALQAADLAREGSLKQLQADALHNIQEVYVSEGNYAVALKYAMLAFELRKQLKNPIGVGNALNAIGIIYDSKGSFSLALDYYLQAYKIFKNANAREKLAMTLTNLGVLFKAHEDYDKAISYYKEALNIYSELKRPTEVAFCLTNLGSAYYFIEQYDLSLSYSLKAEKAFKELNLHQILPYPQSNAGIAFLQKGRVEEARRYLKQALGGHTSFGNKKEMAFCNIQLGRAYLKEDINQGLQFLNKGLILATEIEAIPQIMEANKSLAEGYELIGDAHNSYEAFKVYASLKDSLFKKNKIRLITDFETKYETEKKEQQIKNLHQQSTIQSLKLKQRNMMLVATITLLLIALVIASLISKRRKVENEVRLQSEINKQQEMASRAVLDAEERERRRIAIDLHDGVGQLLSTALMSLNGLSNKLEEGRVDLSLARKSLSLVNESYDEMRSISHQMIPTALIKVGLIQAVEEFLSKLDGQKLKVNFFSQGVIERLDEQTETAIYRIIQETVNNVIKHAQASKLSVQIYSDEEDISVTIEDNGKGFDYKNTAFSGIGVRNILSRVEVLKGHVDIDSSAGRGTLVAIVIPLKKTQEALA